MTTRRFDKCKAFLERARAVTPVGAQTYSKSYRYLSGTDTPYFIERGENGHVWDIDGNEFIDFVLALGPVTVGYNHPEINEAIRRQLDKGITFSQSTTLETEVAERLIEIIPCAEMVRFVKNGADATSAAVRLARAATGRDIVALCGYHGMQDWYVGTTALHQGVPDAVCKLSASFRYNDLASLEQIFDEHSDDVAAVILEPVQAQGPENGFLEKVKAITHRHGAVLIFDEVVSGFRLALGGAQEFYGIAPDLAAIGKGVANGMPLSAVVGRKDLLALIEKGVFVSTTFGGETLSLAAALKTIEVLSRPGAFDRIWVIARQLFDGLVNRVHDNGLDAVMKPYGLAPHSGFLFEPTGALTPDDLLSVYQQRLLQSGILSLGINNVCLTHTNDDIQRHLDAADKALQDIRRAIGQNSLAGILEGPVINPIFPRN